MEVIFMNFRLLFKLSSFIVLALSISQAALAMKWCRDIIDASQFGNLEKVKDFLKQGQDVNRKDAVGLTSLHYASRYGHLAIVQTLLEHKANINSIDGATPLHLASREGHLPIVKTLLEHGANINSATAYSKITPLHTASYAGHLEIVKELIKYGAHINCPDAYGSTPLLHASGNSREQIYLEIIKELLNHGAYINSADEYRLTSLHKAAFYGHVEIVKELLKRGANPNCIDNKGKTPLGSAKSCQDNIHHFYDPLRNQLSTIIDMLEKIKKQEEEYHSIVAARLLKKLSDKNETAIEKLLVLNRK
jgi:ankyrin repeat protein